MDTDGSVGNSHSPVRPSMSKSIEWYTEGEARDVEFERVRLTVRYVGRKGRRARIAIIGPAGTVFRALDLGDAAWSPDRST
jgi:hypothetical protein